MAGSLRFSRLTRVVRVSRVDIYVHWSVFFISALLILGAIRNPLPTVIGVAAYLAVLVIHEAGHLTVARLKGYDALSMEIYPILGIAYYEMPHSRLDRALIAWGGVVAQAVVGIPIVLFTAVLGYAPSEALNAALAVPGGVSICIAAFNLLPLGRLDGSVAWDLIPAFIESRQIRRTRRALPYRSPR